MKQVVHEVVVSVVVLDIDPTDRNATLRCKLIVDDQVRQDMEHKVRICPQDTLQLTYKLTVSERELVDWAAKKGLIPAGKTIDVNGNA